MKEREIYKIIMQDYRCPHCNKLLFKAKLRGEYNVECKCTRCKKTIQISGTIKD